MLKLGGEKMKAINAEDKYVVHGKYIAHKLSSLKENLIIKCSLKDE